jgi:hypothetical protein
VDEGVTLAMAEDQHFEELLDHLLPMKAEDTVGHGE